MTGSLMNVSKKHSYLPVEFPEKEQRNLFLTLNKGICKAFGYKDLLFSYLNRNSIECFSKLINSRKIVRAITETNLPTCHKRKKNYEKNSVFDMWSIDETCIFEKNVRYFVKSVVPYINIVLNITDLYKENLTNSLSIPGDVLKISFPISDIVLNILSIVVSGMAIYKFQIVAERLEKITALLIKGQGKEEFFKVVLDKNSKNGKDELIVKTFMKKLIEFYEKKIICLKGEILYNFLGLCGSTIIIINPMVRAIRIIKIMSNICFILLNKRLTKFNNNINTLIEKVKSWVRKDKINATVTEKDVNAEKAEKIDINETLVEEIFNLLTQAYGDKCFENREMIRFLADAIEFSQKDFVEKVIKITTIKDKENYEYKNLNREIKVSISKCLVAES